MKAGLAANLIALKALERAGIEPGGSVMLQSVIEEEAGGGGGTLACLLRGYVADAMFFTEPGPGICISHAGVLYFRVRVKGLTAHAGRAHEGVNAITKMFKVFNALSELDNHRRTTVSYPLYQAKGTPACHLNLGRMAAGDWPSTVPGFAELEGRISFVPGETKAGIKALVEKTVKETALADPWLRDHPPMVEWFGWQAEPWQQNPEHPFVKAVSEGVAEITGRKADMIGKPAGLDTRFAALFDIPAISFGPVGESSHGCNEYVDLDSLVMATKVVAATTLSWCSQATNIDRK
jgi:acetylornithine deacetylase